MSILTVAHSLTHVTLLLTSLFDCCSHCYQHHIMSHYTTVAHEWCLAIEYRLFHLIRHLHSLEKPLWRIVSCTGYDAHFGTPTNQQYPQTLSNLATRQGVYCSRTANANRLSNDAIGTEHGTGGSTVWSQFTVTAQLDGSHGGWCLLCHDYDIAHGQW